ncbi:hypothetical protein S7711_08836 [Stachybotrys chartarum IBT 7711]|uniref:EDC4-like protein pdc1 beta-propeller domain-containing protein n=1 Tax=Stachybotrys chartarum (strain CBS 109288 / IBT 7711) TaxID=1280523 RepID=A0A084AYT1_STACB|nr:hypothetical protein S7711_08836 [Stachybotrys chartarum IBT 7711]
MDLPPAPTPPVNSGMAPSSDRTANLLNLLKFSTTGGGGGPVPQPQPQPAQQQQQQQQQQYLHHHQPDLDDDRHQQSYQYQQHQSQDPQHQHQLQLQRQQNQQLQLQHQLQIQQLQQQSQNWPSLIHQPAPTGADPSGLLAALMRGAQEADDSPRQAPALPSAAPSNAFGNGEPTADTRSYLLNLLNRPKPSQGEVPLLTEAPPSNDLDPETPEPHNDNARYYDQYQQHQHPSHYNPQQYQQAQHQQHLEQQSQRSNSYVDVQHPPSNVESFSYPSTTQESQADVSALYQQLMGSLAHASPQRDAALPSNAAPPFQVLKKDHGSPAGSHHTDPHRPGSGRSPLTSPPVQVRRAVDRASSLASHHSFQSHHSHHSPQSSRHSVKDTPPTAEFDGYSEKHNGTVAEAVSEIAEQVDHDAREALERAEQARSQPDAPEIAAADAELLATAHIVEKQIHDIKKDLENDPEYDAMEQVLVKDIEESVQNIVDDVQGVADSWESADQEEIVVIEEKEAPPVKVYNFPMKPWISISLQEDDGLNRREFREESIMDIARLKKEFDQMDRNLYTASQAYMAYGMSKQGGLRVIRQEDGKDAKVFTDTKDRIFNLGMSVTPSDYDGVHKESIIGTGVSGTVYWVQIKDGDKDHIEDTHLEQYGFALPPITSQEGDAPGGVLKTRARASTAHPEYFAVGRGKSINLIWPSYIMQNNLFKAGHDRVVDTEALFQQCSLKINTGKAGKDFTFSQDDTVVVSLDKSGRIKFWDVRDLTATKEGSDPRAPLPAQLNLEVKEPLLTLASTPEGEKAWPTSVLLLDKQRPYQKRCALRYMIVGMKQNHTLQLWDLALGKPVQEFNLPHSKESDAVCSVMYHPATGMLVIGHPTRNSVYFAHLSAPKYNLKSVSQAEYIQRLVVQDSSIPQPDSTAVISGVREYSFASRGILRSLDILCNPAMAQESDEPTLFELYAMHSKGVACLLVKQGELGWSKDNKVLDPVDAVAEGIVLVSKLKSPQPAEPTTASELPTVRIANRGAPKETLQATPVQSDAPQRGPESVTPVKVKSESKETETPVQSSKENNQPEKPERKSRKKKSAAAAAAHAEGATNGSSTHATPSNKTDNSKGANNAASGGISSEALEAAIAGAESRLNASLSDQFKSSLKNLHHKIDDGVRTRDESFNQHQLKLLDMVSEVLNENTQKVLESLIHQQFIDLVIPAVGEKAGKTVTDVLNSKLQPAVTESVHKEIQSNLPHALNRALRSGDFINTISDRVSASVTPSVQNEVLATLTQRMNPLLSSIATQTAQGVTGELRQQYRDQMELMKAQHAADTAKIDQLMSYVTSLTEMVTTMAASQSALQAEFLKFKQQPVHELPGISGASGPQPPATNYSAGLAQGYNSHINNPPSHHSSFAAPQPPSHGQPLVGSPQYMRGSQQHMSSPQASAAASEHVGSVSGVSGLAGAYAKQMTKSDAEAEHDLVQRIRGIEVAIQEGRLQEAMIQWIQSGREEEIFRRCLSRFPPSKFENLPSLILLVVIATIAKDLKPNPRLKEEIDWLEMAVRAFGEHMLRTDWDQPGSREVRQSTTQTMQLLINRLNPLMAGIQDGFPTDPFLLKLERGKLEWIIRSSEHVLEASGNQRLYE